MNLKTFLKVKLIIASALLIFIPSLSSRIHAQQKSEKQKKAAASVLWRKPYNIASRNMIYGPGSAHLMPLAPFTFIKEEKGGESPKFDVKDARGVTWRVKLGKESQTETVATRLIWAVGYFAEEAYYFERARIENLPRLSRGNEFVQGQEVIGARFEPRRKNMSRGDVWDWNKNPFAGTRELNGLKVLMILLNNYDARKENNTVIYAKNNKTGRYEARYYVTDLGATLGKTDGFGGNRSKNDLEDFLSTRFVMGVKKRVVEFDYDTRPTRFGTLAIFHPTYYRGEVKKEKSMRGIPVKHARWIGFLLSQLTDKQLRDMFKAANYDEQTLEGYVKALRERIGQLTQL